MISDSPGSQERFFPYRFDNRWKCLFILLRVKHTDGVTIAADGMLRATYGRWSIETSISNIDHTEVTGPHRWYTAVGLRLSGADDGITFGTNHAAGLAISFARKVPSVIGPRDHSSLWVSVAEPKQLAAFIGR
jgi:hypothetical protein